jgi:two-component system phosphate regulon response regulator PhoB
VSPRVLVVDDEPDILELIRMNLSQAGFEVDTAASGSAALAALAHTPPDVVILDVMLPDRSGTDICRDIRANPQLSELAVIMLTAKGEEVDRVVGFELGADDYVTKPFSPRELVLRVRSVLRRRGAEPAGAQPDRLKHGSVSLDVERYRCFVDEKEISLTAKEFGLLRTLMERRGRVLSRERLIELVWGEDIAVTLRTIDTHMKRLREKLGTGGALIDTIRGVGYRFAE